MPSLITFLQVVYPIGVTPNFTQILLHNSVNPHWIPTKIGAKMCFTHPLRVPSFSLIGTRVHILQQKMQVCKIKGTKKQKQDFACSYQKFASNWYVDLFTYLASISAANLVEFGYEISELHT